MLEFEQKLKLLFDAQDFFQEPGLDAFLGREALSDDVLETLFAAGDPFSAKVEPDDDGE